MLEFVHVLVQMKGVGRREQAYGSVLVLGELSLGSLSRVLLDEQAEGGAGLDGVLRDYFFEHLL